MDLLGTKLLVGGLVLLINNLLAVTSTLLLYHSIQKRSQNHSRILNGLYATSAGVIFGLFFIAIFPLINRSFEQVLGQCRLTSYTSSLAPLLGLLLMWFIEEVIHICSEKCRNLFSSDESIPLSPKSQKEESIEHKVDDSHVTTPSTSADEVSSSRKCSELLLTLALGAHALFEGIGVGIVPSVHLVATIGSATGFHEWICIVTLAYRLANFFQGTKLCLLMPAMIAYASLVPVGIFIGIGLSTDVGPIHMAVIMSLVGGALLFVSVIESLPRAFASDLSHAIILAAFAVGLLLIAVFESIAVFVSFHKSECVKAANLSTPIH